VPGGYRKSYPGDLLGAMLTTLGRKQIQAPDSKSTMIRSGGGARGGTWKQ
jgi:hypothetical protein